ncbi:MAG: prepilin peptidase [Candidatus Omnitrophota bacterium]
MALELILKIFVFCLGSAIGSFLNVCIYRMPRKESIVHPASHCPGCKHALRWYDNIPLISYLLLRGCCRDCRIKISPRYFVVELITALLFLLLFKLHGLTPQFLIYCVFYSALIVASFIDIAIREIPDEITLSGIVIGLLLSLLVPALQGTPQHLLALGRASLGMIVGGGSIFLTGLIGDAIFKKETMGGGDVKLLAMVGAFIGWKLVLLTFFLAPFFGAIFGIILKIKKGESFIPYGPFLSLATLLTMVWGELILGWLLLT